MPAQSRAVVTAPAPRSFWSIGVFCGALAVLLVASIHLIIRLPPTGDEPWYLLQGYSLVHFHAVDLAWVQNDLKVYHHFLGYVPADHIGDYRGNGVELVPYLPGYAAVVGPLYALGGRLLIVAAQSLAGALTATLLFQEAYRLWRSRAVALFATLAYLTSLPTLLYAGQIFPSALAALAAVASFVLVTRALPVAHGRGLVATGASIGALAMALPWLHIKYAPLALVVIAAALLQLALISRTRSAVHVAASFDGQHDETANVRQRRSAWLAALLVGGLPLVSFALVVAYSYHYFGTWYPQYRAQASGAFMSPDLGHMLLIFRQMFFDAQSGLVPWVPLTLLTPVGLVLLMRRHRREACFALLWMLGLLSAFLSAAFAPHVNQAGALPARFTVESLPFCALCVAALFAPGWPALRTGARKVILAGSLRHLATWRAAAACCCLVLLAADIWLAVMAQFGLPLLYPSNVGVRLVAAFPHLLPGWWFNLFISR